MKVFYWMGAVSGLCLLSACVSSEQFNQAETRRAAEVAQIRENNRIAVAALENKIEKLNREIELLGKGKGEEYISVKDLFLQFADYGRPNQLLQQKYLNTIALPEKPTGKQVLDYFSRIYLLRNMNSDSNTRVLISGQLVALGHDYLWEMIPFLDFQPFADAVRQLVKKEDKERLRQMILAGSNNNNRNYYLIPLYCSFAGKEDKDFLVSIAGQHRSPISALERLGLIQEAFSALKKCLLAGNYSPDILDAILNHLEGEVQEKAVADLWDTVRKQNDEWKTRNMAQQLAVKGYLPAFLWIVENNQNLSNNSDNRIYNMTPVAPAKQLKKWVEENKGKIKYNAETGKFEAGK